MIFNEHKKILADLKKFEAEIPTMVKAMGTIAQTHFVKSFRNQGFTDASLTRWAKRKTQNRKGRGRKGESGVRSVKAGRAILVKSGALRRSIRQANGGKYSTFIVSNLPYANVHNEGGTFRGASSRSKTITATVRGNSGFVNGKFTRGRSRKIKLKGESFSIKSGVTKMPKRQFIGDSRVASQKIGVQLNRIIKRALRTK